MHSDSQPSAESIRVALDPQVSFSHRDVGASTMVIAHHAPTGKFFKLGPEEYRITSLLDGSRTVTQVISQLHDDGMTWEPKDVADFIGKLVASRLAVTVAPAADQAAGPQAAGNTPPQDAPQAPWSQRLPKVLSLMISQRIPLFDGNAVGTKLEKKIGFVFSGTGMMLWSVLVLSGLVIVVAHRQAFGEELRRMFDPGLWLMLIVLWAIAKVIHEAGHAAAASYHGVRVGKIGIMFFFLAPLAYVDVTDAWKLKSRWSRVQIALAGVYLELFFAALAAWTWWLLPGGLTSHLAAQFCLVAGPATILVNANPLLRLDGYYVVSDLAEIPNLRMHGRGQLAAWLERVLVKVEQPRTLLSGWRKTFATVHAAASVVFQVVWMGGLIIGVSMWAKGLGVVLALAALLLWALIPLTRWAHKIWMLEAGGRWFMNPQRKRLVLCVGVSTLLLQYFWSSESPLARRVPVVVRFSDQQIARAATDAFVRRVYVTRGQRVEQGMLLIELDDPELIVRRQRKADALMIAENRAIQFRRQGEISKSAAESENAESLRRQVAEFDQQIHALQVFAERSGLVVGSGIDSLEGRFIDQGKELLRVSDPQEKELLASISETDTEAYQAATARAVPATVRLRGGTRFTAVPASLRPRARRSLPHPALAATVGGPLPVEPSPDENERMRVIEPQLQSVTSLDPVTSVEIHAGQIGTMTIDDNRSLVARLFDAMK